jgi:hypothetical protein
MTLNEDAILDLFYSHLDEMKMGEACVQILNDEQLGEDDQQQVLGELLLPQIILAFADKYDSLRDDDGADLQNFFEAFLTFEHIPEELHNVIAATINTAAKEDEEEDGVISQGEWDTLSDQERIAKVKAFLKRIAVSGDNHRDQKPFITRGPGPDPYGNQWGKNAVKVFDRKTNRYGHTDNPTTPKGTNAYLQRKPLPNLPITENLLDPSSASKVERYARWMSNNQWITKTLNTSESPAKALMEAGKLRDEHNKRFGLGKDEADWDSVTDARIKGRMK